MSGTQQFTTKKISDLANATTPLSGTELFAIEQGSAAKKLTVDILQTLIESVDWGDITGKPTFATVAISGSYNDLSNKPTIPTDLWERGVDANDAPVAGAIKAKDFTAEGTTYSNTASGISSLAFGANNNVTSNYSVGIGYGNTVAGGGGSAVFGTEHQVTAGTYGFATGVGNTISHNNTVAMGWQNTASNYNAVAMGYINTASGHSSVAMGNNNTASGHTSVAVGYQNTASGSASYAEGRENTARGGSSHAEGRENTASGSASHAEGQDTTASGENSHSGGTGTVANSLSQTVFGEYNTFDSGFTAADARGTYIEIVGNGDDAQNRSNARTLDWSGNEWVAGLISVGSSSTPPTPTANNHLTTKKYVDDIVGNIETLLASI